MPTPPHTKDPLEDFRQRLQARADDVLATMTDYDLAAEIENAKYRALTYGVDTSNRLFVEATVKRLQAEVARRERLRSLEPGGPMTPATPQRDPDLRGRIARVHTAWPLERAMSHLFMIRTEPAGRSPGGGQRFRCTCPYPDHQDDSPSFVIYPDGAGWCFGCNRGGDVIDLTKAYFGVSFREALERLEGAS